MERYRIKVYRFNPAIDKRGTYDSYTFDSEYQPTVLEALRKIRDERDANLAFRESCGLGKCGSCAVMMNGDPVLACQTPLMPGEVIIEPLRHHEILKDLVIERSDFHDCLREKRAFHAHPDYLIPEERPFQWNKCFQELSRCIGCLMCESACPSFGLSESEFPGPALLTQLSRSLNHPFAKGNEEHVAWVDGIHNCTACMNCTRVCPKDLDPFRSGVLPLRAAISKKNLMLPRMQEVFIEQYIRSGRVVPVKDSRLEHEIIDIKSKIALFLGCMFTDRRPGEGKRILDLLSAVGIKVQVPGGMVCCGGPLMWVGKSGEGREAFGRNMDLLINCEVEQVITPCIGCSLTLKRDYADLYREKTGKQLPFVVMDITEILNDKLGEIDFQEDRSLRAVFHLPCHHDREDVQLTKSLEIQKVAGIEIVGETNLCCGGMVTSSNPSMVFQLSSKIIEYAESLEADILATTCIFCRDNLYRASRSKRSMLKVEHILLLLARQVENKR